MSNDNSKYPKQPYKPDRKPSESVTWVRNLEKITERKVIVIKKSPVIKPKWNR